MVVEEPADGDEPTPPDEYTRRPEPTPRAPEPFHCDGCSSHNRAEHDANPCSQDDGEDHEDETGSRQRKRRTCFSCLEEYTGPAGGCSPKCRDALLAED